MMRQNLFSSSTVQQNLTRHCQNDDLKIVVALQCIIPFFYLTTTIRASIVYANAASLTGWIPPPHLFLLMMLYVRNWYTKPLSPPSLPPFLLLCHIILIIAATRSLCHHIHHHHHHQPQQKQQRQTDTIPFQAMKEKQELKGVILKCSLIYQSPIKQSKKYCCTIYKYSIYSFLKGKQEMDEQVDSHD